MVAAVKFVGTHPSGLRDSKLLSAANRERLATEIAANSCIGFGCVSAATIDQVGLADALRIAVGLALQRIEAGPDDSIVFDGTVNYVPDKFRNVTVMPKADMRVPEVSAASIVAKVKRDRYMAAISANYPMYGFDKNAGYGTQLHTQALRNYGVTPLHRQSFKPIKKILAYGHN